VVQGCVQGLIAGYVVQAVQESIQWKHVAEGGFGNVCVGSLRVAAKVPRFNTSEYQVSVDTEASTLMSLSHPNIVRPLAMMECRTGQRAMLMEFFKRGTLQENFRCAQDPLIDAPWTHCLRRL
jgi:serine/threonine protein kinase